MVIVKNKKTQFLSVLSFFIIFLGGIFVSLFPSAAHADLEAIDLPANDIFFRAKITQVLSDIETDPLRQYSAVAITGPLKGQEITIFQEAIKQIHIVREVTPGDVVVVFRSSLSTYPFELYDLYRANTLWLVFIIFFAIVIGVTSIKGIRAIISLLLTLVIIGAVILPLIIAGINTFLSILFGATLILAISLFLTHGFHANTLIAWIGSNISLLIAIILGWGSITYMGLLGLGSDEAIFLQLGNLDYIDLRGLLLGAMILGTVGVLDDVTIIQASAVKEIQQANPSLSRLELYKRGIRIGHEHIVSMVNTLFIAYAGASLPLILFLGVQSDVAMPLWVKFNSEAIIEEILRSIIGSAALVLSVPITTALAAYWCSKKQPYVEKN